MPDTKRLYVGLLAVLLCLMLSACEDRKMQPELNDSIDNSHTNPHHNVSYDTLQELQRSIKYDYGEEQYAAMADAEGQEIADNLRHFIDALRAEDVPVPCQNGQPIELQNEDNFSNITVFLNEAYDLPWIWVFPAVSTGENFYIQYTPLPAGFQADTPITEVLDQLAPSRATKDNFKLFEHLRSVSEEPLILKNRTVTVQRTCYRDDSRDTLQFVYGDLLVIVRCDPEIWTDDWFVTLSFE